MPDEEEAPTDPGAEGIRDDPDTESGMDADDDDARVDTDLSSTIPWSPEDADAIAGHSREEAVPGWLPKDVGESELCECECAWGGC